MLRHVCAIDDVSTWCNHFGRFSQLGFLCKCKRHTEKVAQTLKTTTVGSRDWVLTTEEESGRSKYEYTAEPYIP